MRHLASRATGVPIAVLMAISPAAAQTSRSLDAILNLPPSPGSVALLIEHVSEGPALVRLGAALRHTDPGVRASAARVLFVAGNRGMSGPMMVALDSETSPEAAMEEIRFLVHFGSPEHRRVVEERMTRLGPRVTAAAAIELARSEGTSVLARLPVFKSADVSKQTLTSVIGIASNGEASVFERVLRDAVAAGDRTVVEAALDAATELQVSELPEPLLLSILASDSPQIAVQGVWYLARNWDGHQGWNPDVLRAMARALDTKEVERSSAVSLAREIVGRLLGARPNASAEWRSVLTSADFGMQFLIVRPFAIETLSTQELDTAARGLGTSAKLLKETRRRDAKSNPGVSQKNALQLPAIEAASDFPPGFATDVFRVTGCQLDAEKDRAKSDGAAGGIITLRDHGRPANIAMITSRVAQPACVTASQILLQTSVAVRENMASDMRKTVFVPLDLEFFACQEASGQSSAAIEIDRSATVTRPKKIRHVPPIYPQSAIDDRVQGIVIVEATISPEGCISRARVVRGVDARLDWSAVRALLQWRFTPTLLNGTAVPVLMTVTAQFSLN